MRNFIPNLNTLFDAVAPLKFETGQNCGGAFGCLPWSTSAVPRMGAASCVFCNNAVRIDEHLCTTVTESATSLDTTPIDVCRDEARDVN